MTNEEINIFAIFTYKKRDLHVKKKNQLNSPDYLAFDPLNLNLKYPLKLPYLRGKSAPPPEFIPKSVL